MTGFFVASMDCCSVKCIGIGRPGTMLYFKSSGLILPCNATFSMSWSGYVSFTLIFFNKSMFFVCSFVFINNTPLLK